MIAPPEEMWFGNIDGQWPIYCWASEGEALFWIQQAESMERRRLWKARVVEAIQLRAVAPKPYLTQAVEELAP